MNLSDTLPPIRKARKLSQEELGAKMKPPMRRTDVNAYEKGRKEAGPGMVKRFAAALEVSVLELSPEAEADAPGLILQTRLEALEAERERDRQRFDRMLQVVTRRLAALEEAQAPQARPADRRSKAAK